MVSALAAAQEKYSLAETVEKLRDELELVDYVTGHDLQAPLRAMQNHCEMLAKQPDLTIGTAELVRALG